MDIIMVSIPVKMVETIKDAIRTYDCGKCQIKDECKHCEYCQYIQKDIDAAFEEYAAEEYAYRYDYD